MPAHNWLRGRSPFTAEMFLLLKADPDLNFCNGLRWALVPISHQLFTITAATGPCWDQSFLLLSRSYKLRDRFTIWRKRTEQECKKGNIIFLCIFVRWQLSLKVYEIFGNWTQMSSGQCSIIRYPSSVFCIYCMVGMRVEWNKLWSCFACVWQLFHELPSVCASLCPWSPFPYIEISLLQNFSGAVTNQDVLKNNKWQIK